MANGSLGIDLTSDSFRERLALDLRDMLEQADYQAAAEEYLLNAGLTENEIMELKTLLSAG